MSKSNENLNNLKFDCQKNKFYKIGKFSEMLRVNVQTLRIYDKEGILCPKRSDTNRRGYTDEDFARAKIILYLTRGLFINLNGVKLILKFLEKGRLKPELGLELIKDMVKSIGISDTEITNNLKRYNDDTLGIFETL